MLHNIPSAALKELVKLSERKEALMARIQEIDREMLRVQSRFGIPAQSGDEGAPVTVSRAGRRPTVARRSKRGALKEKIMRALRATGGKGASIADLSKKLGVPTANLYVWFSDTGKNIRGLKKIGPAKYRLL
jgi:hypothetical protein